LGAFPAQAKISSCPARSIRLLFARLSEAAGAVSKQERTTIMIEPKEILEAYELHGQALVQANALNKTAVFDALTSAGVTVVIVTFDGEGDSGQIENIQAHAGEREAELPTLPVQFQKVAWNSHKLDASSLGLREAIEGLCYDYLERAYGGWENNDGGFGDFTFDVAARQIDLEFNVRFSDFTTFSHTF
jgi:hypothetical protein